MTEEKKIDMRYIPTVLKTSTPMMLLKVSWKCPNCGGRAEEDLVTCEQSDAVTKNFAATYCRARWCKTCYENNKIRFLDEAKVLFLSEKQFTRWASGRPEKAPTGERVPKG